MPVAVVLGADRADSTRRLAILAVAIVAQSALLVVLRADPTSLPPPTGSAILALSAVTAGVLGLDAYRSLDREDGSWWRPDWRRWALGGAVFGANAGFAAAYVLRRREAARSAEPTGRWKLPVALTVVAASLGTGLVELSLDVDDLTLFGSSLLLGLLVTAAFTLVAIFYDTRYVADALEADGSEWLLDGYHWVVLVGLPVPGRLLFLLVYLYRRRTLLGRVAPEGADIDALPTGDGGVDGGRGGDSDGRSEDTAEDDGAVGTDPESGGQTGDR